MVWYNTIELEFFLMRRELSSFACDAPARSFADRLATEGVLGLFLAFYVFIRYDVSKRFMPPSVHHRLRLLFFPIKPFADAVSSHTYHNWEK